MSLRDIVSGSDACTADGDGAGPSNAMGALVNNLLGGTSKQHEQLRELPVMQQPGMLGGPAPMLNPQQAAMASVAGPSGIAVPGVMPSQMHNAGAQAFAASISGPGALQVPSEWDNIYGAGSSAVGKAPMLPMPHTVGPVQGPSAFDHQILAPGAPPAAVGEHVKRFFSTAVRTGTALPPPLLAPAATAPISVADRVQIRDRSTIIARQVFAEQGEAFADQQVGTLLESMHIRPHELPSALPHAHDPAWHDVWAQQQQQGPMASQQAQSLAAELAAGGQAAAQQWDALWGQQQQARPPSTGWADEFARAHPAPPAPATWAQEFSQQQQQPGSAWAEEFSTGTDTAAQTANRSATDADALASTRAMVDVLSRDADPKMQNSKFLQFISKMSKGELMFEDNKVVERPAQANQWASEFDAGQRQGEAASQPGDARWADEFARQFAQGLDFGSEAELEAAWKQHAGPNGAAHTSQQPHTQQRDDWIREFSEAADEQTFQEWERIYGAGQVDDVLNNANIPGLVHSGDPRVKGEYVFSPNNPFLGDEQALTKGKDLFRRGVLSEAALALEAEVTAHPDNAEAWRLLGTVHAENDDDHQAIAAMLRALKANPRDLDVLLSLGVSHVNELDQSEAVQHLATWLSSHPRYSELAATFGPPLDSSQSLSHVLRMFSAAAAQHQDDAELAVALGILRHLARQYQEAIEAFETALRIRPQDYSLWNKLGATLANNARSSEAIHAYQKALDLKPNYMRAWTNMGISLANVGEYEKSARFYVRALALNPRASHVWGYLRTSLACAGALELMKHVDNQDLDALNAALPLE